MSLLLPLLLNRHFQFINIFVSCLCIIWIFVWRIFTCVVARRLHRLSAHITYNVYQQIAFSLALAFTSTKRKSILGNISTNIWRETVVFRHSTMYDCWSYSHPTVSPRRCLFVVVVYGRCRRRKKDWMSPALVSPKTLDTTMRWQHV